MKRGAPRPASLPKPALSLLAVSGALFLIARTTGSGWIVVLLAVVGAVGVLSIVLPFPAVVLARVELETPADGTAGRPLMLRLSVRGTSRPLLVRIRESDGEWVAVAPPVHGMLEATPPRRGVISRLTVDIRCGAPIGLMWWQRSSTVDLERPIEVGPAPIDASVSLSRAGAGAGSENLVAPRAGDELVRGVREYHAGDPIKTVHWAATAHHGHLMVRETEADAAPPLAIELDMGTGGDRGERAASLAAGLALHALRVGRTVFLLTCERNGPVDAEVRTPVEVSRRLARAVPAAAPAAPAHSLSVRVDQDGVHA
jgi:uncharacterized protein (DUF58 family)